MQTMPAMVYLIPGIIFFGVGVVPGIVATIIFAMPPGVRMTELGIRQVDERTGRGRRGVRHQPRAAPCCASSCRWRCRRSWPVSTRSSCWRCPWSSSPAWSAPAASAAPSTAPSARSTSASASRRGVAVVILAMYLDRMTGALDQRVSPLGRRALAKAQRRARRPEVLALPPAGLGRGGRRRRPRAGRGRHGHLRPGERRRPAGGSANVGKGKKISIGYIPWDEGIATTFLWKEMLEQRGYKAEVQASWTPAPLYTGLARGEIDFQTDAWLPTTHAAYWKKYKDKLEDLGSWYGQTSLELAVPVVHEGRQDSLDGPQGQGRHSSSGKIIGIEPSAGEMRHPQGQGPEGLRPGQASTRSSTAPAPVDARRAEALDTHEEGADRRHAVVAALGVQQVQADQAQGPQGLLRQGRRHPHARPQGLRQGRARGRQVAEELQDDREAAHQPRGRDPGAPARARSRTPCAPG